MIRLNVFKHYTEYRMQKKQSYRVGLEKINQICMLKGRDSLLPCGKLITNTLLTAERSVAASANEGRQP